MWTTAAQGGAGADSVLFSQFGRCRTCSWRPFHLKSLKACLSWQSMAGSSKDWSIRVWHGGAVVYTLTSRWKSSSWGVDMFSLCLCRFPPGASPSTENMYSRVSSLTERLSVLVESKANMSWKVGTFINPTTLRLLPNSQPRRDGLLWLVFQIHRYYPCVLNT